MKRMLSNFVLVFVLILSVMTLVSFFASSDCDTKREDARNTKQDHSILTQNSVLSDGTTIPQQNKLDKLCSIVGTRIDIFKYFGNSAVGVELGVRRGDFSFKILNETRVHKLYSIDAWKFRNHLDDERDYAAARLKPFAERSVVLQAFFHEAVTRFSDENLDFVYIDGFARTGSEESRTFDQWWPKVKYGWRHIFGSRLRG